MHGLKNSGKMVLLAIRGQVSTPIKIHRATKFRHNRFKNGGKKLDRGKLDVKANCHLGDHNVIIIHCQTYILILLNININMNINIP